MNSKLTKSILFLMGSIFFGNIAYGLSHSERQALIESVQVQMLGDVAQSLSAPECAPVGAPSEKYFTCTDLNGNIIQFQQARSVWGQYRTGDGKGTHEIYNEIIVNFPEALTPSPAKKDALFEALKDLADASFISLHGHPVYPAVLKRTADSFEYFYMYGLRISAISVELKTNQLKVTHWSSL